SLLAFALNNQPRSPQSLSLFNKDKSATTVSDRGEIHTSLRVAARGELEFIMQFSNQCASTPATGLYGNRKPSPRQQEVIALVAQGLKNSEVANLIGTSEHVVKNHLR